MDNENTLESAYRYFYALEELTAKEMANLICDNDLRQKKSLKYANSNFKNVCQRIRDTVKRRDIKFHGQYTVNTKINSKILFEWAAKEYPEFYKKLPPEIILNNFNFSCTLPQIVSSISLVSIPDDTEELRHQFIKINKENMELKEKIQLLEAEIKRLRVFEIKKKGKLNDSRTGGKNSKGTPKHY